MNSKFGIRVLSGSYKIVKLPLSTPVEALGGVWDSSFYSITKSPSEYSVVCEDAVVLDPDKEDRGWALLMIDAVMDFDLVGILAGVLNPLREAEIGIFAVSTFDTDYILVRQQKLDLVIETLRRNGYQVDDIGHGGNATDE
ncbi:MAG: ACT domain-containing protein [Planctomycetota bacterium]